MINLLYLRIHTHTCVTALCPGLPGWAGTRKVKPIWILLKQESEWQWHQSAPCSRQITMPAPHRSFFYRPDALSAAQPTVSKHCRHGMSQNISEYFFNIGWESDGISHLKLHDDLLWCRLCHLAGGTFGVSAPKSDKQATSVIRIWCLPDSWWFSSHPSCQLLVLTCNDLTYPSKLYYQL